MSQPTFSSPTPAPGSRAIAASALRKAGLIDQDAKMRDASEKPGRKGGVKQSTRSRTHPHKPRAIEAVMGKEQPSTKSLTARISASNPAVAQRLLKTGGAPRGRRNAISLNGGPTSEKVIDLWKEWVNRRWNPEAKFLNLERMNEDDFLKRHRLTSPASPDASREAQVVFKIASKLKPEVETVSLAHNGLANGRILVSLAHYLPRLANLSLEGNNIGNWKEIDYVSGKRGKLDQLRELVLVGNPMRELEYKNNRVQQYKSQIARRFPSLEILDGEPVARVGFDAPSSSTSAPTRHHTMLQSFAWNMEPSFIAGVDGSIVSNFFVRYFPLFDNQRGALLDAYAPDATFSFSANTGIPPRARIEGIHVSKEFPNQRKLEWPPWLSGGLGGSRNLGRMAGGLQKLTQSLHLGSEQVVKAMLNLPATRHDVSGSPEKFSVDAFPIRQAERTNLLVTIHGQFAELPSEGIRSFDRSFVLAIAPEGSRAKQSGWDVVILSDQLVVRAYSSFEAWRPGPMRVQAGDLLPSPGLQQALAPLPEPQRALMQDLVLRTRLNLQFAEDCLKNNDWDLERALANFEQVKVSERGHCLMARTDADDIIT
ncbi:NTF2-like protein [Trametes polyzona]|nr:NTF2-like protein [Trametes polyzona]